jgi:hypothetical protein
MSTQNPYDRADDQYQAVPESDGPGRRRAAAYRRAIFAAISPDEWRQIVALTCEQALEGEPRAREWVLKLLGVDDAVKSQAALDDDVDQITHGQLLVALAASIDADVAASRHPDNHRDRPKRETRGNGHDSEEDPPAPLGPAATYRQAIFDVVTPGKWQRIVAKARSEALAGDQRAREWILKLLGVDDVVEVQAAIDDSYQVVTINTLMRAIKEEEGA